MLYYASYYVTLCPPRQLRHLWEPIELVSLGREHRERFGTCTQ